MGIVFDQWQGIYVDVVKLGYIGQGGFGNVGNNVVQVVNLVVLIQDIGFFGVDWVVMQEFYEVFCFFVSLDGLVIVDIEGLFCGKC